MTAKHCPASKTILNDDERPSKVVSCFWFRRQARSEVSCCGGLHCFCLFGLSLLIDKMMGGSTRVEVCTGLRLFFLLSILLFTHAHTNSVYDVEKKNIFFLR